MTVEKHLAIGFGLITVDTEAQAIERAKVSGENYGGRAVAACIEMMKLRRKFGVM
jgi:6,7-dimethyl-8-ribityllumazine synthase